MKSFSHKRPVRDEHGNVTGERLAPVWRRTERDTLGYNHGPDRGRRVSVGLLDGDLIALRPAGTRREPLTILATDLYEYLLRKEANVACLAKARAKKEKKAIRLANQRQERAEKRLVRPL